MFAASQRDPIPARRARIRRAVQWLLFIYALVLPSLVWLRVRRQVGEPLLTAIAGTTEFFARSGNA